jgi:hypothetical protein
VKDSQLPEISIQRNSRSTFSSTGSPRRNLNIWTSIKPSFTSRQIAITALRINIDNPSRNRCLNRLAPSLWITKIPSRHTRYTTWIAVIVSTIAATVSISITMTTIVT